MTTIQPELTFPSAPVPDDVAALLALIDGDPLHASDREHVVTAIRTVALANGGVVDPNVVRDLIPASVYPRVIGATYQSLTAAGVIAPDGWVTSTDRKGRNSGRPARRYRWLAAHP